jgi:hypothetical protein
MARLWRIKSLTRNLLKRSPSWILVTRNNATTFVVRYIKPTLNIGADLEAEDVLLLINKRSTVPDNIFRCVRMRRRHTSYDEYHFWSVCPGSKLATHLTILIARLVRTFSVLSRSPLTQDFPTAFMTIIDEYVYAESKCNTSRGMLTVLQTVYRISFPWATSLDVYSHRESFPLCTK